MGGRFKIGAAAGGTAAATGRGGTVADAVGTAAVGATATGLAAACGTTAALAAAARAASAFLTIALIMSTFDGARAGAGLAACVGVFAATGATAIALTAVVGFLMVELDAFTNFAVVATAALTITGFDAADFAGPALEAEALAGAAFTKLGFAGLVFAATVLATILLGKAAAAFGFVLDCAAAGLVLGLATTLTFDFVGAALAGFDLVATTLLWAIDSVSLQLTSCQLKLPHAHALLLERGVELIRSCNR